MQQLDGEAPDILAIPVGNAGNITAYWKALKNIMKLKDHNCRKCLASKLKAHHQLFKNKVIKNPETIATAIRINPASWDKATNALKNQMD